MNWTIIAPILTSSVLAAFLTKSLDLNTAKITYKRDYYKKVIEERLQVYIALNKVLYTAVGTIHVNENKYNVIFESVSDLYAFTEGLIKVAETRIWLDTNTANKVAQLVKLLSFSSVENNITALSTRNEVIAFGIEMTPDLIKIIREIEASIINDMKKMHDVKRFFKTNVLI